ncbi:MAG TPA: hypothetical protein VE266_09465 [Steroidobacteraceae bacterium]|jgi:hypothetical protein|nr:hypothetical protein [Steroidobacteraceae bacterium]
MSIEAYINMLISPARPLEGFAEVNEESYAPLLRWGRAAKAAGFDRPA